MIRVVIADDHPIVRKGFQQILTEAGAFQVEPVSTIPELRECLTRTSPDVLVLDINMPGGNGIEFLSEVRQLRPRLPVLVLSTYSEEQAGARAIAAGAQGFLNKQEAPELIVEAVTRLRAGGRFITPGVAELVADRLQNRLDTDRPHTLLSGREHTVFLMIVNGKSTSDIAAELNLSPKTVSTYRTRILEKMQMNSTAELTRYAVENSLVD